MKEENLRFDLYKKLVLLDCWRDLLLRDLGLLLHSAGCNSLSNPGINDGAEVSLSLQLTPNDGGMDLGPESYRGHVIPTFEIYVCN